MSAFRNLMAEMDAAIFEALTDDVTIKGLPVKGLFLSPWLGPQIGHLNTGLVEPQAVVKDADAAGVEKGDPVTAEGGNYVVVRIEPDGTGVTTLILRPAA